MTDITGAADADAAMRRVIMLFREPAIRFSISRRHFELPPFSMAAMTRH